MIVDRRGTPAPRTIQLADVDLACWDTGGDGEPVVLLHAAWGSGELWTPQLASLAATGYRAITYSRRGHRGSAAGPVDRPGTAAGDLRDLAAALGLGRFHLVGTALGGGLAVDLTLGSPDRVATLTLVSSLCGITDADFVATTAQLVPPPWQQLPIELRELGPAYRFWRPAGAAQWAALTAHAVHTRVHQPPEHVITADRLAEIAAPTLVVTGDADPYVPPPRMAAIAALVPGSVYRTIPGAGHSPPWEEPDAFDEALIAHLQRTPIAEAARPGAADDGSQLRV